LSVKKINQWRIKALLDQLFYKKVCEFLNPQKQNNSRERKYYQHPKVLMNLPWLKVDAIKKASINSDDSTLLLG
jgi:hypothetical protein